MRASASVCGFFLVASILSGCIDESGSSKENENNRRVTDVPPPSADSGQVRGTVVDDSSLPIPDAEVGLLDGADTTATRTDDTGAFVFTDVTPGSYRVQATKVGFGSHVEAVQVAAGEITEVNFELAVVAAAVAYHLTYVGHGYIACGLYAYVVTVSNLNMCAWDTNHKPRYEFTAPREGLMGVLQEIVWQKTSALTSDKLIVYLWYKPVCDPTCNGEREYASSNDVSPIRQYSDLEGEDYPEDPVPLASMTFVGGTGPEVVFVFQQKIDHYVTAFYGVEGDPDTFTALPS